MEPDPRDCPKRLSATSPLDIEVLVRLPAQRRELTMPQLLSINNYYYRRGGAEVVFLEHNRLFTAAGWDVIPFAMQDPQNLPSPWSGYFADAVDLSGSPPLRRKITIAGKMIYSFEAARRVRELVRRARPAIAHAHNIYHHLSPSVLRELRRRDIPVVLTLHDYKVACPAYRMFTNGTVCERCRSGALRHVIGQRCIRGSLAMSALIWLESTIHRQLQLYSANVNRFVAPSRFLLKKLGEWGFDMSRFVHIPNFVSVPNSPPPDSGNSAFVYVGRLVAEKGVATLIRAAAGARVPLVIVGSGPDEASFRQLAAVCGGQITFSGHLSGERLREATASARAVVVPSEWYENAPISLMEAYALGRPVIGAKIGGIPELVHEGETGFLFESGNLAALTDVLVRVRGMRAAALDELGRAGREWMRAEFTPELYRERMLALYQSIGTPR
jgi:glycosyltransferase involved in cell wall biosynthesis